MRFDRYALIGRVIPAFFSIIVPILVFNHFFTSKIFSDFVGGVLGAKVLSNLTISGVSLYYLSEVGRFLGKHLFENFYFEGEAAMPTTTMLLFKDKTYSAAYKKRIKRKVLDDFGIKLPNESDEIADERTSRTRIVETMALIRKQLHGNAFLLQHNIEYGAMRNAIGGSVLGAILCIINMAFFSYVRRIPTAIYISGVILCIYLLFIAGSKVILNFYGVNYAKVLFREYMGSPPAAVRA